MPNKFLDKICANRWAIIALAAITIAAVFWPLANADFLHYDDPEQLFQNQDIRALNPQSIDKIFHSFYVGMYQPLTTLGYAIEYRLFGLNPRWFHIDNLLLHLLAALLVIKLSLLIFKDRRTALAAGLLFALWPTQVEAVAWLSARSTLLSACLALASIITYLYYRQKNRLAYLIISVTLFGLGCLAKSSVVILPALLLLLDWRLGADWKKRWPAIVPYVLLAGVATIAAILGRQSVGIFHSENFYLWQRIILIASAYAWQLYRLVWPFNQSLIYERPSGLAGFSVIIWAGAVLPLLIGALLALSGKIRKAGLFYCLWFFLLLLPSLQIIPFTLLLGADRYNYLACLALIWPLALLWRRLASRTALGAIAALLAILIIIGWSSCLYAFSWRSSVSLWDYSIDNFPSSGSSWVNRGLDRIDTDWRRSLADFEMALKIDPINPAAYNARGIIRLDKLHNYQAAVDDFNLAISYNHYRARYYYNLGRAFRQLNAWPEALKAFTRAQEQYIGLANEQDLPANILLNRAYIHYQLKNYKACVQDTSDYLILAPDNNEAFYYKGLAELNLKNPAGCPDLKRAMELGHQEAVKIYHQYCQKAPK
ncbi:MAG: tetratricopeptide repeat protein [Candidatus Falkowbacteria bacterium]